MTGPVPVAEVLSMPIPQKFPAVARLRQHFDALPPTDADLLGRFATSRDEDAFRELVRRHGPAVLAVCRRVAGNRDDADDAFQATFLVLARKPDRVRAGSPLGGWLYGVAVRAARKAVARTARRRGWETAVAELPEVPDHPPASDPETVRAVLEEVARLSGPYRAAVVLCELEGRPRAAAARELGIPEGTLSSRLAAARKQLARRFRDRGLAPAVLAAVGGSAACPVLAADAARLAGASASPVPSVELLSEAVMRTAFLSNWKVAPVALGLVAAAVFATGLLPAADTPRPSTPAAPRVALADPPKPAAKPAPAAKPLPKGPNEIVFWRQGELVRTDPDGKNEKVVLDGKHGLHPMMFAVSPDGTKAAVVGVSGEKGAGGPFPAHLFIRDLGKDGPGDDLGPAGMARWSADGTALVVSEFSDGPDPKDVRASHRVIDLATSTKTRVDLPDDHLVTDWSRDGRYFLTTKVGKDRDNPFGGIFVMNRDGTARKQLADGKALAVLGRFSPDGRLVLFMGAKEETPAEKKARQEAGGRRPTQYNRLGVVEVATGKVAPVRDVPLNADLQGFCWSPDGKRIAYVWREARDPNDAADKETVTTLVTCDPDGGNQKTVTTEKGRPSEVTLGGVDWR